MGIFTSGKDQVCSVLGPGSPGVFHALMAIFVVYDAFQLPKSKSARPCKDVGIRYAKNSMPSVVVLSCLEADYKKTYHEMTLWMAKGQGKVQAVILFCYTISIKPDVKRSYVADEWDSPASLRCVVRLFEYDESVKNHYRQVMVAVCIISNFSSPLHCTPRRRR